MKDDPDLEEKTPGGDALYRCLTKGVQGASEEFEYGLSWVTARRGKLEVFSDRIECGDWRIPNEEIEDAVLFKTRPAFRTCYILKIRTADESYQFGLNGNSFWEGELPFEVRREKGHLEYSNFSIAIRIVVIVFLLWYFFLKD